jgi:hypothetical protein
MAFFIVILNLMKYTGKRGKRQRAVGYRTASHFLCRKSVENKRLRSQRERQQGTP